MRRGGSAGVLFALTLLLLQHPLAATDDVILLASDAAITGSAWSVVPDSSAAGGSRVANVNVGAAKLSTPLASPASYFELTFHAAANTPYRLWLRMRTVRNSWADDSVHVQFSNSVTATGTPTWRIGTTSGTSVTLEDCTNCGVSGWGWQDNAVGSLGTPVYFAATGEQRLRVQVREDGASIDQVVLSPSTWFTTAPGALKNDTTHLDGGAPPTLTLAREPYLQHVTDTSAVIVWASREPGPASARVGTTTVTAVTEYRPPSTTGMNAAYYQHVATIGGLTPLTTYQYDVWVNGVAATTGADRVTTAPPTGSGRVRFVAFGDSGIGSIAQRTISTLIGDDVFDLALHTGDMVYGASNTTGDASYARYHEWYFDIYRAWLRRRPMFPVNGNHDSRATNNWGLAYRDLFVLPENGASGVYPDHAERYYSFDYGPIHFVMLDTERAFLDTARRAEQLAWLEDDLASTTQPWKIAVFHRPGYSADGEHVADPSVRAAFSPLFEQHGVQLVLTGHQHNFERTVPWRESTDLTRQAVTYYVTGGGGARLYRAGKAAYTAASAATYHYLRGDVLGCVATIETVNSSDTVIDRFTLDRCRQEADAAAPAVDLVTPSAGATVSDTVTVEAEASDDTEIVKVDFLVNGALRAIDAAAPYRFSWNAGADGPGPHDLQVRAYDLAGRRSVASANGITVASSGALPDVVLYASDATTIRGLWRATSDASAAAGVRLETTNAGISHSASADPANYFDVTFDASSGVPYHLWLRLRAQRNTWPDDSVYVQFSGAVNQAGTPLARIGTTNTITVTLEEGASAGVHGWGWNDQVSGGFASPIYFATGGTQTLRVQLREDGAWLDQFVLSPGRYLNTRPGALKDDTTIIAR